MVPTQTLENFPPFGDNATKVQPDNAKYAAGFQPSDVYPAEWVNWIWGKSSNGVTKLNAGVDMMEREINNVLEGADKTPDATKDNQLLEAIQKLITDAETRAKLAAHPIGSLYWSSSSTDPGTLFGGTWTRIKDKFILAAGDTYTNGDIGGSATVTLSTNQIPSHTHTFGGTAVTSGGSSTDNTGSESAHTHSVGAHSHGLNSHKHSVGAHAHGLNSHTHGIGTIATASGGGHTHRLLVYTGSNRMSVDYRYPPNTDSTYPGAYAHIMMGGSTKTFDIPDSNWLSWGSGENYSGYARYGNWGTKHGGNPRTLVESDGAHTHTMSGSTAAASGSTANSTAFDSGAATGSTANSTAFNSGAGSAHSHSMKHTHSVTAAGINENTGGGQAHDNMPPYVVKYCWERTA